MKKTTYILGCVFCAIWILGCSREEYPRATEGLVPETSPWEALPTVAFSEAGERSLVNTYTIPWLEEDLTLIGVDEDWLYMEKICSESEKRMAHVYRISRTNPSVKEEIAVFETKYDRTSGRGYQGVYYDKWEGGDRCGIVRYQVDAPEERVILWDTTSDGLSICFTTSDYMVFQYRTKEDGLEDYRADHLALFDFATETVQEIDCVKYICDKSGVNWGEHITAVGAEGDSIMWIRYAMDWEPIKEGYGMCNVYRFTRDDLTPVLVANDTSYFYSIFGNESHIAGIKSLAGDADDILHICVNQDGVWYRISIPYVMSIYMAEQLSEDVSVYCDGNLALAVNYTNKTYSLLVYVNQENKPLEVIYPARLCGDSVFTLKRIYDDEANCISMEILQYSFR